MIVVLVSVTDGWDGSAGRGVRTMLDVAGRGVRWTSAAPPGVRMLRVISGELSGAPGPRAGVGPLS
jgi:hypothetical protein